jgi:hypothetical protein
MNTVGSKHNLFVLSLKWGMGTKEVVTFSLLLCVGIGMVYKKSKFFNFLGKA